MIVGVLNNMIDIEKTKLQIIEALMPLKPEKIILFGSYTYGININITKEIETLIPLTYYAVEGRYAIIYDDLGDTDKYIKQLDELLEFVKIAIDDREGLKKRI